MLDHIGITVGNYEVAKAFYSKTLASIGYKLMIEVGPEINPDLTPAAGFGIDHPFFWIDEKKNCGYVHVAFRVDTRALVDAFYAAALAAGGKENGAPGLRTIYHPTYYGAFVLDPWGHNIEAVCYQPYD